MCGNSEGLSAEQQRLAEMYTRLTGKSLWALRERHTLAIRVGYISKPLSTRERFRVLAGRPFSEVFQDKLSEYHAKTGYRFNPQAVLSGKGHLTDRQFMLSILAEIDASMDAQYRDLANRLEREKQDQIERSQAFDKRFMGVAERNESLLDILRWYQMFHGQALTAGAEFKSLASRHQEWSSNELEARIKQTVEEQLAGLPDWPTTREDIRWKLLPLIYQALEEVPDDAPAYKHLKAMAEAAWEYEAAEDKERAYFETYREGIREALHAANTAKEAKYGEHYPGPDEYYQEYDEPLDEDYDDHE